MTVRQDLVSACCGPCCLFWFRTVGFEEAEPHSKGFSYVSTMRQAYVMQWEKPELLWNALHMVKSWKKKITICRVDSTNIT